MAGEMTAAAAGRWPPGRIALAAALAAVAAVALVFAGLALLAPGAGPAAPAVVLVLPPVETPAAEPPRAGSDGGLIVPAVAAAAYAGSPELPPAEPLAAAPDPALLEAPAGGGAGAGLPRIAADGRQPWQAYARPFDRRDARARLVFVVLDVGLARAASEAAVYRLPAPVSLAVDADAPAPQQWAAAARRAGHEVLAAMPLQAPAGSGVDAGPRALLAIAGDEENTLRAQAVLGRFTGYTGVLVQGGSGFADGFTRLQPLIDELQRRGLLLVDGIAGEGAPLLHLAGRAGLPRARIDALVAGDAAGIDRQLAALAATARERFVAVGALRAAPVAVERLRAFLAGLDAGRYVLAPVSAVVAGEAG